MGPHADPGEFVMPVAAAALGPHPVKQPLPPSLPPSLPPALPRRLPVPATEPPYDEQSIAGPLHPVAATQGTLALSFAPPAGTATGPRPALHLVPDPPPDAVLPPAGLPTLAAWADTIALAIAQVLTGERTAGQLRPWTMPEVFDVLARRASLAAGAPRRRAALRSVNVCCPARGIAEVCTVVHGLARPRALAFRLEARRNRWVCTELELG